MQNDMDKTQFFCEYYKQWIEIYKRGAIREATMAKYLMTCLLYTSPSPRDRG